MKVLVVITLIFYSAKIQASQEDCNDINFNILNDASRNVDNIDGGYCDSLDSPYMSPDWKGPGNIIIFIFRFEVDTNIQQQDFESGAKKDHYGNNNLPYYQMGLSKVGD